VTLKPRERAQKRAQRRPLSPTAPVSEGGRRERARSFLMPSLGGVLEDAQNTMKCEIQLKLTTGFSRRVGARRET